MLPEHQKSSFHCEPLEGSKPVPMMEATGCKWPIGHSHPMLYCNEPVFTRPPTRDMIGKTLPYCRTHSELAYIKVYVAKPGSRRRRK